MNHTMNYTISGEDIAQWHDGSFCNSLAYVQCSSYLLTYLLTSKYTNIPIRQYFWRCIYFSSSVQH